MTKIALRLAIAVLIVAAIGWSWNPTPFAQMLAAIFIAVALIHAVIRYGAVTALAMFACCLVVTFAIENFGAATGFPFGHYHFAVGANLPRFGLIPLIVGPLWFGMGYFSFVVAAALLDGADRRLDQRLNLWALPVVAAFVMTQWDLVMDPPDATIARAWIWHDGGGDFGVPLSNYLGWLLTAWLFCSAFALILRWRDGPASDPRHERELSWIAVLFYLSAGLTHLVPYLMGQSGTVADATGQIWRIADIRETTVAVLLFTMLFTSLLAALRLWQSGHPD
jgi:putative membrane protein